uniref:Reverse transcriptase domain-containing protein n=1 Tax=Tanacetum cinerariifolium TaxID=118510 RepID=A0A6L2KPX3_TANCI|nr:hypothetical protein [Tanacetum cinerariifolium]
MNSKSYCSPVGVARALAARDADRSRNGKGSHDSGMGVRRQTPPARECTYPDFMKCQPLNFKGTEGVVELTQWFKKMETMFRISNCFVENQIKFSTYTLLGSALTWRNSHVMTVGLDVAYAMTCVDLKKKMTDKYCPRGEMKKLKSELWNLKVKGTDVIGMPDMIHGSVVASKPKTMQEAIEMQQPLKKQCVSIAYTAGPGERKDYAGTLPLRNKCKFHHNGQCTIKCVNCKRVCHLTQDCRSPAATNNHRNPTFYGCENQGYYRSDCPELKNQDHGNQAGDSVFRCDPIWGCYTSCPVTPAEEVVNSGHSSTLSSLVTHESPRGERMRLQAIVTGRPYHRVRGSLEEASWEWMEDSHTSWVADVGRTKRLTCYVQGSGRRKKINEVDRGNERRDCALFGALVILVLVRFLIEEHEIPATR